MTEIEAITKLATYQMSCDGYADKDELIIMQNLPERMQQHINSWSSGFWNKSEHNNKNRRK